VKDPLDYRNGNFFTTDLYQDNALREKKTIYSREIMQVSRSTGKEKQVCQFNESKVFYLLPAWTNRIMPVNG
jgi:hypothetical protein